MSQSRLTKPIPKEKQHFTGGLDCCDVLESISRLPDEHVHSVITDPPYGISYLGNTWDQELPEQRVWEDLMRVLVPGGYIVAAASAKRYHHLATAIEAAGYEIRGMLIWQYNQSSPGSSQSVGGEHRSQPKPNHDPWVVARKPFPKGYTLKDNWNEYEAGAVLVGEAGSDEPWLTDVLSVPKATKAEKDFGLGDDWQPTLVGGDQAAKKQGNKTFSAGKRKNNHPSPKPIALMRRIVRMYTPPGRVVYDPFMGSGSTLIAAVADGYPIWGNDIDPQFSDMADDRIQYALRYPEKVPKAL